MNANGYCAKDNVSPESIVLASRTSGCLMDTQALKNRPSGNPNISEPFLKMSILSIQYIEFFHLNIIPMALCKDLNTMVQV